MAVVGLQSINGADFTGAVEELASFRVAIVKQTWD